MVNMASLLVSDICGTFVHLTFCALGTGNQDAQHYYMHARTKKVLSERVQLKHFFSLMRGGRIKIPLLAGHQRPASETPFI